MEKAQDPNELLSVVDENDQFVECRKRSTIHKLKLTHRAVSVLVFNSQDELYLQLRSPNKDTHPLKWTTSASGHVDCKESYEQAAVRELQEELGLKGSIEFVGKLKASSDMDNEFMSLYRLVTDATPTPNPIEIQEGRFFPMKKALDLAQDLSVATPSLKYVLNFYIESWAKSSGTPL